MNLFKENNKPLTVPQQAQMAEIRICMSLFPSTVTFIQVTFALNKLSCQTPREWSCWIVSNVKRANSPQETCTWGVLLFIHYYMSLCSYNRQQIK